METPEELQAAALAEPEPLFPRPEPTMESVRIRELEVALAYCAKRLKVRATTQADLDAVKRATALLGVR